MEKYRVAGNIITKHKVVKETKSNIYYIRYGDNTFENKTSKYVSWHDTFEEAKKCIMGKIQREIDSLLRQINYQEGELKKIHKLEKF